MSGGDPLPSIQTVYELLPWIICKYIYFDFVHSSLYLDSGFLVLFILFFSALSRSNVVHVSRPVSLLSEGGAIAART